MRFPAPRHRAVFLWAVPAVFLCTVAAEVSANDITEEKIHSQWKAGAIPALNESAGQARAGKLCFPNGKLHISDFVRSQQAFRQLLDDEIQERSGSAASNPQTSDQTEISLASVKASLCAKNWGAFGMGDRKSLSGKVAFNFTLTTPAPNEAPRIVPRQIELHADSNEGRSTEDFLSEAIRILIEGELLTRQ